MSEFESFMLTGVDPCEVSFIECITRIGPSWTYALHCHPSRLVSNINLCRKLMARVEDNPMAPYVNVVPDATLEFDSWFLEANGKRVGSRWP